MSANRFGDFLSFTSFGESHGPAVGVVIDGFPAGVKIDMEAMKRDLARRRPGQSDLVSARNEADEPEVLSGIFEGKTLGTPICLVVRNRDHKSEDYEAIKNQARIGHADDTWKEKFGHVDHRGGGRSSGRETLARVIAGTFAKQLVLSIFPDIKVFSYASEIYNFKTNNQETFEKLKNLNQRKGNEWIDSHHARFVSHEHEEVKNLLLQAKEEGKSYGGKAKVYILGLPKGVGQPIFHKLKADLASAFMGIGATYSVELGEEIDTQKAEGSEFHSRPDSQKYGGIRGGISTGEPISMAVGFKPTSSVKDIAKKGRHDPCIIPRACPVLEAMTYFTLADHILWMQTDRLDNIN